MQSTDQYFAELLEAAKAGTWEIVFDRQEVIYDNNFAELMGYKKAGTIDIQNHFLYLMSLAADEETRKKVANLYEAEYKEGIFSDIYHYRYADGIERYITNTSKPVYDAEGKIIRVTGIAFDVTEKELAAQELRRTRERLDVALNASNAGVWEIDVREEERKLYFEENFARLFRFEQEEPFTLPGWADYLTPIMDYEKNKDFFDFLRNFDSNIDRVVTSAKLEFPDGVTKYIKNSAQMVYDNYGNPVRMIGMTVDITERTRKLREDSKELALARDEAERASQAKSSFLSNMSHEIRTPMTAIMGLLEIAMKTEDMEHIKVCLTKMQTSSFHLLNLLNDILDMSKIESGNLEIQKEPFNLEKMLSDLMIVIGVKAHQKEQEILIQIDRNVPRMLVGDVMRLSQVIMNLLSNAIKFSSEQKKIYIDIHTREQRKKSVLLEFSIRDEGLGITEDKIPFIFDSFRQADSSITKRFGGTGLGLAISKAIIEKMGGNIKASSKPGEGSTFTFTVCFESLNEESGEWNNPGRILILDDSKLTRIIISKLLAERQIDYVEAESGEQALMLLEQQVEDPIRMALIDYNLPGIDGIEFAKEAFKRLPEPPVMVLMSMSETLCVADRARAEGINFFLQKPVLEAALGDLFEKITASSNDSVSQEDTNIPDYTGKNILVVEDSEINREITRFILEAVNANIFEAENGQVALEMYAASPENYDFIFMDVQMPVMDGYTAALKIRESGYPGCEKIPIVAMTANVFKDDVNKAFEAKMNAHIGKPINTNEVYRIINKYL